ncbi:DNA-protecting protein DprA [Cohnella endophytica]|uniref:DNA-protecting protein DprA n=1 Tax=Cohnella endophytica TaxID=2419778 RepID=A0A494XXZ9_9BACL|nr:DNA-processing protein DprA [Cohnella endophytica]RKP55447.1 DNA-protecting protein DprA [Cohnella endophytica]
MGVYEDGDSGQHQKETVRTVSLEEARLTGIGRDALIALHETDGVGRISIATILLYGATRGEGSLSRANRLLAQDWRDMGLFAKQSAAIVANLTEEAENRRKRRHAALRLSIVTYLDDEYPELLRQISDPPWVLYYKGDLRLAHHPAIAIVGTRLATGYGRKMAEDVAKGCSRRMTVVSGLARGIDAAAHSGAVRGRYGTIAVLAGSVDYCYPPENKALYRDISENGLILSESPPDTVLRPGLFPLRNRIIAGLSYGVIVVEAARRSGALITADLALGYDRDIFVVPGQATSPRSLGALEYFRKGAHPVLDETDIFEMYKYRLPFQSSAEPDDPSNSKRSGEPDPLTGEELAIYEILLEQPCSIDDLAVQSGMTFGHLHSVLLSLLIKRRIHQQPGSVYHVL